MAKITTPEEFFGFKLGTDRKIARWDKVIEYFYLLEKESGRIQVTNMGPSTLGNDFLKVVITSEENMANLEEIRETSLKLSDPRGLNDDEIESLIAKGKAVSVQSMSLHATEIGGTQMAPVLAHKLCSCGNEEVRRILDNTVLVMVPCFNPDGQIMVTDFYNESLGTDWEGCNYPSLYHHYTGHDNNRDGFAGNIIETKYMADILFHEWAPQSFQDHHHMGSYGARIQIAPYKNPLRPYVDPITWRELNWYGANMAYRIDAEGLEGVSSGAQFPAWGHYGFHWLTNSHNIAGMLTESASAKLATPKYIHPTQLTGDNDITQPDYAAQTNFPNPWKGGWWTLSDIMERMYWTAYSLMDTMARNKEHVLRNMVTKALRQTKAGEDNPVHALIIPADQHDKGTADSLVNLLLRQAIEIHVAEEDFMAGNVAYGKGSRVVYLAQPRYGVIMSLLHKTQYPDNQWTRDKSGALTAFDSATDTVFEYMGVKVIPAGAKLEGKFKLIDNVEASAPQVSEAKGYVISAKENDAFFTVNLLFEAGYKVCRINTCPWWDFYVEITPDKMNEILKKAPTKIRQVDEAPADMTEIKPAKVAMYQRYYTGNADEGWTRLVFDRRDFSYTTVFDNDIISGGLKNFDVLIIPSDDPAMLKGPKYSANDPKMDTLLMYVGQQAEQYQSGLGSEGALAIKEFVENGGRLLAFNQACDYAIDTCGLPVVNLAKGKPFKEFNTHGSTLNVEIDNTDNVAWGMPKKSTVLHWNGPVLDIKDRHNAHLYKVIVKYADANVLESGLLTGEGIIAGKGAVVSAKHKKGEVVLYGFSPQWRAQTHGTFKLLFNMMYLNK